MIIDRINEEIKNIRLFFRNVWLLLSFDPLDKPIFLDNLPIYEENRKYGRK